MKTEQKKNDENFGRVVNFNVSKFHEELIDIMNDRSFMFYLLK